MCNMTTAVQIARRQVCVRMCGRPLDVSARLPFDPHDKLDVQVWILAQVSGREWSGDETVAYIVRWILWQAEKAARGNSVPTMAFSEREFITGKQDQAAPRLSDVPSSAGIGGLRRRSTFEDEVDERESASEMVVCTAAGIRETSDTERSAVAVLSCAARLIHAVKSTLTPSSARHFIAELFVHPVFLALCLPEDVRLRFQESMMCMKTSGSFRRDLHAVGWSCPGHQQWCNFSRIVAAEWEKRFSCTQIQEAS